MKKVFYSPVPCTSLLFLLLSNWPSSWFFGHTSRLIPSPNLSILTVLYRFIVSLTTVDYPPHTSTRWLRVSMSKPWSDGGCRRRPVVILRVGSVGVSRVTTSRWSWPRWRVYTSGWTVGSRVWTWLAGFMYRYVDGVSSGCIVYK